MPPSAESAATGCPQARPPIDSNPPHRHNKQSRWEKETDIGNEINKEQKRSRNGPGSGRQSRRPTHQELERHLTKNAKEPNEPPVRDVRTVIVSLYDIHSHVGIQPQAKAG